MKSPSGKLIVKAMSAELKKDLGHVFKQDPYVILQVGDQKHQTKAITRGGKNPTWNETFEFDKKDEDLLKIQLYDKDTIGSDKFLGEGSKALLGLLIPGVNPYYIEISDKGKETGKVLIETEFKPEGGVFGAAKSAADVLSGEGSVKDNIKEKVKEGVTKTIKDKIKEKIF